MGVLKNIKNIFVTESKVNETPTNSGIQIAPFSVQNFDLLGNQGNSLNEVTYMTCLKILSETLGKLDLKLYQKSNNNSIRAISNQIFNLLSIRINPYMTPSAFWSTVEQHRNHFGNAYVWIQRTGTTLNNLWIMNPSEVLVMMDNVGLFGEENAIFYQYNDPQTGQVYLFNEQDVLHFKSSMTFYNGVIGMSINDILETTMQGKLASQEYLNNMYKTGLSGRAVLQYTGDLSEEAKQRMLKGLENFATGSANAGKIIPIPVGMQIQPLNVSLADAQFEQLKKYTDLQIASAFGIPSNMLNNMENSSYSSVEAQNLNFLVNTMSFILKQYEQEISYKLLSSTSINQGMYFEFDVAGLLRADITTKMNYLSTGVINGIFTQNEARGQLGLQALTGGDQLIVNGTYIPSTMLGANYGITPKGGDNGGK